jgi:hypothetical protein
MRNIPAICIAQPKETRMTFARTVLAAAAMALACGVASAQDKQKDTKPTKEPRGFNEMDKNDDGKLSRTEAASKPQLLSKWKELDKDNDGSLSRTEYLREMARQDGSKVQERVSRVTGGSGKSDSAATGGTAPQSQRK